MAISLLFFVPFIWTVATSFKTIPDSVNVVRSSRTRGRRRRGTRSGSQYDFKLYVTTASSSRSTITVLNIFLAGLGGYAFARLTLPGSRAPVLPRARDADDPRPAAADPRVRDAHELAADRELLRLHPDQPRARPRTSSSCGSTSSTIPRDFEEAAKLDGAGYFKTFWRVMLPLALPAIAALTILQFQGTWNDFFWPLILFGQGSAHLYTVQLGLAEFALTYRRSGPSSWPGASSRSSRSWSSSSSSSATSSRAPSPRG